ncbi:MAG: fumarylacetoacetate hydrolase family protein [Steroidobacteraceae bacterium]
MKLCRFNHSRIGLVERDIVYDITELFNLMPQWPLPQGDWIISQITPLLPVIKERGHAMPAISLASVRLESPVANPGKIIGAPINYKAHIDEANAAREINYGKQFTTIEQFGLFIKASSSLIGPSDSVQLRFPDRRSDHEVELSVIIGREARMVKAAEALDYVLGYSIGLDMTVRGPEFPGFRKSVDSYSVLGPWIVTGDEVGEPDRLDLAIKVNGEVRQRSNTSYLLMKVRELIAYASRFYTLYPGDVIMTGTPEGVSQVMPGDIMEAEVERIGTMRIGIASEWAVE